jgi:outer membrane protein TolC
MTSPLPANALKTGLGSLLLLAVAAAAQAPLTLTDAIREARRNSDEARLVTEKSAKLDAMKRELWAGALPHITAYANGGRGSSPFDPNAAGFPGEVVNPTVSRYAYGVEAQQSIFSFGRLGQSFRVASRQIASQDKANQRELQQIELSTLDAFYAMIVSEARVKVLDASLERQRRTSDFLQSNFRRGAGARSATLLAAASLKGLEPERIRAVRDADAARMALNRLLGRDIEAPIQLDTSAIPGFDAPAADTAEANLASILERRPDLESIRLQKETLKGYATAYRMQYLPALGATGKIGVLAYDLKDQLTDFDKNLEWQVGVGLTWPIFDGLANSSKARQYDSDARALAVNERRARAFARIEVEGARREAAAADTALSAARQARDAAAEALELISQDFRAGAGQVTDLLSAEEGLRNAELGLLAARYQNTRARAALRVSLGLDLIEGGSK